MRLDRVPTRVLGDPQGLTTAGLLMWHFSMVYKAIQKYADENSASKLLQHTLFITIMLLQCAVMWGNTAYDIDVLKKEAAEDNYSTGGGLGQLTTDTGLCPDTTTGKGCAFELCTTDAEKIYYRLFEVNSDIVTPVDATVAFASLLFLVHLVQTVLLWQWEKEFGAYDTLSNQSNQPSNVGTGGGGSGDSYQQL